MNESPQTILDRVMAVIKRLDREDLYDHERLPAVLGTTNKFVFFENPQNDGVSAFAGTGSKTEVDTNLQLQGQVQDGEWFFCDRFAVTYAPRQGVAPIVAGPVTFTDADLLKQDIRFLVGGVGGRGAQYRIKLGGEQLFWQLPGYMIGSGVNESGIGHQASYDTYNYTPEGMFMLSPGVRFKIEMTLVNTGNFPSANPVVVGTFLDGWMIRPADYGASAQKEISQLLTQLAAGMSRRTPMAA